MKNDIQIHIEYTPNPNTLKFVVNRTLLEKGAANFTNPSKSSDSPLAERVFGVPGVSAVMVGTNFVTITKSPNGNWDVLAEEVPKAIQDHLGRGGLAMAKGYVWAAPHSSSMISDIEKRIREVLDNEIRPAVAMDGGDIEFGKYEDGVVYLHLQGSCSACPSSVMTLKMGVEARLKEVVPEIKEVVQI